MRLAIASDHTGVDLKLQIAEALRELGVEIVDLGTDKVDPVDYPDYAAKVTVALSAGRAHLGLLICGTGIGMSIAANKAKGIRAALCRSEYEARMARAHNNANVLCLGQRVTGPGLAMEIAKAFVTSPFEGGRHARRLAKLEERP